MPKVESRGQEQTSRKPEGPAVLPEPNGDFYQVTEYLTDPERAHLKQVRAFMEAKVAPVINKYWAEDAFPFDILPGIRDLGIVGLGYQGYGCAGGTTLPAGFGAMESAGDDCSCATFLSVPSGLGVGSLFLGGSEEQTQRRIS